MLGKLLFQPSSNVKHCFSFKAKKEDDIWSKIDVWFLRQYHKGLEIKKFDFCCCWKTAIIPENILWKSTIVAFRGEGDNVAMQDMPKEFCSRSAPDHSHQIQKECRNAKYGLKKYSLETDTLRQSRDTDTYLIFVTDTRTVSVEKKLVMWRNFKFLYMTDEEKSKISPHVD